MLFSREIYINKRRRVETGLNSTAEKLSYKKTPNLIAKNPNVPISLEYGHFGGKI